MQLEYAKNPVWANAEHTMIDITIKWDAIDEELPFTASPNDTEEHGRAIFAAAQAGEYGTVADYVPPPAPTTEELAAEAEANRRAAYIAEADPLFFKAQRGEATVQEWQDKVAEIKARYPKETV
jgi:hypothetical protein